LVELVKATNTSTDDFCNEAGLGDCTARGLDDDGVLVVSGEDGKCVTDVSGCTTVSLDSDFVVLDWLTLLSMIVSATVFVSG